MLLPNQNQLFSVAYLSVVCLDGGVLALQVLFVYPQLQLTYSVYIAFLGVQILLETLELSSNILKFSKGQNIPAKGGHF